LHSQLRMLGYSPAKTTCKQFWHNGKLNTIQSFNQHLWY